MSIINFMIIKLEIKIIDICITSGTNMDSLIPAYNIEKQWKWA